ncbi:protein of unknown function [Cupriavidus taiwanensis]|nr:protein of unknown function [Cupriavidus taiwanensis]
MPGSAPAMAPWALRLRGGGKRQKRHAVRVEITLGESARHKTKTAPEGAAMRPCGTGFSP